MKAQILRLSQHNYQLFLKNGHHIVQELCREYVISTSNILTAGIWSWSTTEMNLEYLMISRYF